jgi:hypothetical protein
VLEFPRNPRPRPALRAALHAADRSQRRPP